MGTDPGAGVTGVTGVDVMEAVLAQQAYQAGQRQSTRWGTDSAVPGTPRPQPSSLYCTDASHLSS